MCATGRFEDLDIVLNDGRFILKQLDYSLSISARD